MQGLDQLLGSSGTDVGTIGAQFGLTPEQTRAAMASLMPAVAGGFQKRADAGDLDQVVAPAAAIGQPDKASGDQILSQIFGSKDVSRQVAGHAAGQAGVSSAVMKAMLPVVAAMLAKRFAKGGSADGSAGGGLGDILGSVLGGGQAGGGALPGGLGGMFGGSGGANPLDAILGGLAGRR